MPLNASALGVGSPGFETLIQTDRQFIGAALFDRIGIVRNNDFLVTPDATSHSVIIAAGKAAFPGTNAADQGFYFAWSESAETLAWPAPSATARIDTLVLRVGDPQYGTVAGTVGAYWDIIQGVPAASPVPRSDTEINTTFFVPGAWMRVANVRINVADTGVIPAGNITDMRPNPHKWTMFTPTVSGFTLGNGNQSCAYKKIDDKTIAFRIQFNFGSTSTFSGLFSLGGFPFSGPSGVSQAVSGFASDTSASDRFTCTGSFSGNGISRIYDHLASAGVSNNTPFIWAASDSLVLTGVVDGT